MNVENSSDTETMEDVPVEDYFDDIRQSGNARGGKMGSGLFDLAKMPFLAGIGVLVLIILMVFIFSGKGTPTKSENLQDLEKRITILEDKIAKMGKDVEDIRRNWSETSEQIRRVIDDCRKELDFQYEDLIKLMRGDSQRIDPGSRT